MSQKSALSALDRAAVPTDGRFGARVKERLRHVLWAVGITLVMTAVFLLEPVDQFIWLFQSKIAGHKPSGDIVFVSVDEPINDPVFGHRRVRLANALRELDRRGVGKVYIDIAFEEESSPAFDEPLSEAIALLGPRVVVVDQLFHDAQGKQKIERTVPELAGQATRVISDKQNSDLFDVRWVSDFAIVIGGKKMTTLGAALGGARNATASRFQIDYGFGSKEIDSLPMSDLVTLGGKLSDDIDLAGKSVVIGYDRQNAGSSLRIPNSSNAPASYVEIYAAESLKANRLSYLGPVPSMLFCALALALVILLGRTRKRRWIGYTALVVTFFASLIVAARIGIRMESSYALGLLGVYASYRLWTRWKRRVAHFNQDTGLPTLKALEARLIRLGTSSGFVVVAKVHNYEHILKTLKVEDRSKYLLKLVDRFRAADPNLAIFSDSHYLAWHSPIENADALQEHLSGLRAIFASPVNVGGNSVDVGITFGAVAIEGDPINRVPAATAAVEETNEALEPIRIAESASHSDMLWDISLRARIDAAMEAGEIYCLYQPKIDRASGSIAGVEALVRWHDPARGFIEPLHFVQQCEKAGRMEHLTRYVLQSACSAGQLLHFRGTMIKMSVNISATLLGDMRIVGIVRNILQATRFDPRFLVLEVTETSRIADLSTAAAILSELRALGLNVSIDDFGMGAANFETFFALPFDELKIDRLFVSNMLKDPKARAIVSSLVAMGREARITIVAEGVETPEEVEILNEIGCDELQGYVFSRPISLSKLLEFNENREEARKANMV
ncbi:EAL domain-containing protein [Qipengyuania sp. RANM35]|uniref:EAL domain-containing protein n=1 Tax=Qipengyuania sp. RANM35 TaxID=3068635 RepID=UPI0034DB000A